MAQAEIDEAVRALRAGEVIGLPTETVYGLAADASNELAVRRIFAVKGRPSTHPLIVHLAKASELSRWAAAVPPFAETLARAFWPGPLTLVLKRSPLASDAVTGGQDTVALRVPRHPLARAVLEAFGGGVAAPSANRFGGVSPTTAAHVREDLGAEVPLVLDGGPCEVGVESTIVDLSGGRPALLRPGGVSRESIEAALAVPLAESSTVRAPGTLASHYAPRAGLRLCTGQTLAAQAAAAVAAHGRVAVLGPSVGALPSGVTHFALPEDDAGQARALYATLRQIDEQGFPLILAALPSSTGLGLAVGDRLRRAASPRDGEG